MDDLDRRLILLLRQGMPLVSKPYELLAKHLRLDSVHVLFRIHDLEERGVLTKIRGFFDARSLGYQSALVALQISGGKIEEAAEKLTKFPGIVNLCRRDHVFSLWGTLALPEGISLKNHAQRLGEILSAEQMVLMPALKTFKIGRPLSSSQKVQKKSEWTALEKRFVQVMQTHFPLVDKPYQMLASEIGISEEELFKMIRFWMGQGWIKPILPLFVKSDDISATSVLHAWRIPEEKLESIGKRVASFVGVERCVQRAGSEEFPFSLFASLKVSSIRACHDLLRELEGQIGQWPSISLLTLKEYSCSDFVLFPKELQDWDSEEQLQEVES